MDFSFLNDLNINITLNANLSQFTTFKLGGQCPALITCDRAKTFTEAILRLRTKGIPFLIMGFGSNILASDKGINKIILRFNSDIARISRNGNTVNAEACTHLDDLTQFTSDNGLEGLSQICGIPGTLGGAIAGNAGAYGQQISDHLISVTVLKPDNQTVTLLKESIRFDYRDSDFKHNNDIILSAEFGLKSIDNTDTLKATREHVLQTRPCNINLWKDTPCAGSFFRNVEPTSKAGQRQSAGWFLDNAGCKSLNINGAHAFSKHANIITRDDGSNAQAVYDLTKEMARIVREKYGINLIREVRLLGAFDNAPECDEENFW